MSTFFEVLQGRIREKQLFSEMFITFFCPTYAQPAKDIGFYIVSLVGQVLVKSLVFSSIRTVSTVALAYISLSITLKKSMTFPIAHMIRR